MSGKERDLVRLGEGGGGSQLEDGTALGPKTVCTVPCADSKRWFTTSFLGGKRRKAMLEVCIVCKPNRRGKERKRGARDAASPISSVDASSEARCEDNSVWRRAVCVWGGGGGGYRGRQAAAGRSREARGK